MSTPQTNENLDQVLNDPNHVLAHLLPNKTSSQYNLRPRQHDRQLISKMSKIYDNNFIFVCCTKMYIDFVALAIISDFQCTVFYTCMFMMHFVIVFLNEYE